MSKTLNIKAKYPIELILQHLNKNLIDHKEDYKKAVSVYNSDVITALTNIGKSVKKAINNEDLNHEDVNSKYYTLSQIVKPVNAEKMYEEYISLFEASSDRHVELTFEDANAIINDSWDWAIVAKITNSSYSSRY